MCGGTMASGTNDATFPMTIREVINFLSSRYSISQAQATSAVYALLESEILSEEVYALRFMDTLVKATISLEDLDAIVRQLVNSENTAAPSSAPASPAAAGINLQLTATIPQGLGVSFPGEVETMRSAFSRIVGSARDMLKVASPYIEQPGLNLLLHAFETAAKNGAKLRVLARIDDWTNPNMRMVMAILTLQELFGKRVEIRSFSRFLGLGQTWRSLGGIHAKLLIADDAQAYVGSGEIRDHSLNHNFEVGFVVSGLAVVAMIARLFDTMWDASSKVTIEYCQSFVK